MENPRMFHVIHLLFIAYLSFKYKEIFIAGSKSRKRKRRENAEEKQKLPG